MGLYVTGVTYLLARLGAWDWSHLKATVLWFFTVAFVMLFGLDDALRKPGYFRSTAASTLEVAVFIEFLMEFRTLHLALELVLVPLTFLLGAGVAFARHDRSLAVVGRLFEGLLVVIGAALAVYGLFVLVGDVAGFAQRDTVIEFALAPVLTTLFLPFVFALAIYSGYENAFVLLPIYVPDASLKSRARLRAIRHLLLSRERIARWPKELVRAAPIRTIEDLDRSLRATEPPPRS